jgi:hypothetical protein
MDKILIFFRVSVGAGDFFLPLKHPECRSDQSVPSSDKAKNEWSYTYAPCLCLLGMHRDFTFTFTIRTDYSSFYKTVGGGSTT